MKSFEKVRTFIALELPPPVKRAVAEVQREIGASGVKMRWVAPANIHLTLAFLGDVPSAMGERVNQAVETVAGEHAPLTLAAAGIGVFPHPRRPRVLWVGTRGDSVRLNALKKHLDSGLESVAELGYTKENRPFKAHLTLARAKGRIDPRRLIKALENHAGFETADFTLDQVHVFKSQLTPKGAVYSKLHSARLTGSLNPG